MNLDDLIKSGTRPPRIGTRVCINDNAQNCAFRGVRGRIVGYHVRLVTDNGEYATVTARSVDIFAQE